VLVTHCRLHAANNTGITISSETRRLTACEIINYNEIIMRRKVKLLHRGLKGCHTTTIVTHG